MTWPTALGVPLGLTDRPCYLCKQMVPHVGVRWYMRRQGKLEKGTTHLATEHVAPCGRWCSVGAEGRDEEKHYESCECRDGGKK